MVPTFVHCVTEEQWFDVSDVWRMAICGAGMCDAKFALAKR